MRSATDTSGVASFSANRCERCTQVMGVLLACVAMRFVAYCEMGCSGSSLSGLPEMMGMYSSSRLMSCLAIMVLA